MHVALYARVSTTRQADNDLSIPDQIRQLKDWCKANACTPIREYVESGASAMDDKRPVFQQMIADAQAKPAAFEAILIHSFSRFFRDGIEFGSYERKLKRHGVKIISITQPTSDDAGGDMMRRIINLFDEHQSRENSKHTHRAMCENVRQGFYSGSKAPFGFKAVATEISGSRGRKRKRLELDQAEAIIVRTIYDLYLNGFRGKTLGIKEIGKHLTQRGQLMRGNPWSIQKIHKILSDRAYLGEHVFNKRCSKTGEKRPADEWVTYRSEPIVTPEQFHDAQALRKARSPRNTPPRLVNSPTLLTGLLRCACGHRLTAVTGKSGRYHYYKCANRQSKGNHACDSRNIPMEKLDALILDQFAEKICAPERLNQLMTELRKRIRSSKSTEQEKVNALTKLLKEVEKKQRNLLDAVENGLAVDEVVQRRSQELKSERQSLMIELTGVRRIHAAPQDRILPSQVEAFSKAIRAKLQNKDFAKRYLHALVDEIVVTGDTATMKGSYVALAQAISEKKKGTSEEVPSSMFAWRARSDSNARPLGS
ncbi:recombinase family protein [Propionivibrio dicarboxylicus]|uniref:Site-specific DNA recombinase n=1 Tax=Propionivibrio dicarboxylicus TaxID=83767 RepID=A0A1G7WMU6_9RHOO|nr:recombinase family protein [Propionivibrio dicarboxylicus]SDG73233.1 Site-specific DNA recombinase [Propionivibrio dicarboxylicus]